MLEILKLDALSCLYDLFGCLEKGRKHKSNWRISINIGLCQLGPDNWRKKGIIKEFESDTTAWLSSGKYVKVKC